MADKDNSSAHLGGCLQKSLDSLHACTTSRYVIYLTMLQHVCACHYHDSTACQSLLQHCRNLLVAVLVVYRQKHMEAKYTRSTLTAAPGWAAVLYISGMPERSCTQLHLGMALPLLKMLSTHRQWRACHTQRAHADVLHGVLGAVPPALPILKARSSIRHHQNHDNSTRMLSASGEDVQQHARADQAALLAIVPWLMLGPRPSAVAACTA